MQTLFAYKLADDEIKQHTNWFWGYLFFSTIFYTEYKNIIARVAHIKEFVGERAWKVTPRGDDPIEFEELDVPSDESATVAADEPGQIVEVPVAAAFDAADAEPDALPRSPRAVESERLMRSMAPTGHVNGLPANPLLPRRVRGAQLHPEHRTSEELMAQRIRRAAAGPGADDSNTARTTPLPRAPRSSDQPLPRSRDRRTEAEAVADMAMAEAESTL
jgi:hypothetical protein